MGIDDRSENCSVQHPEMLGAARRELLHWDYFWVRRAAVEQLAWWKDDPETFRSSSGAPL